MIDGMNNNYNNNNDINIIPRWHSSSSTTDSLLNRLKNGEITKQEVQRLILSQNDMKNRLDNYEQNRTITSSNNDNKSSTSINLGNVMDTTGYNNSNSKITSMSLGGTVTTLGSRNNPMYMRRQTTFKEFVFSLFPFLFIFWMLGGFDMIKSRKVGQGGLPGIFSNNYSEWDEEDWEDDDETNDNDNNDDDIKLQSHDELQSKLNIERNKIDEENRRQRFFNRLGIHLENHNNEQENDTQNNTSNDTSNDKTNTKLLKNNNNNGNNKTRKKKKRIRFKDVCGNDEAKTDLMDLVDYLKNPDKYKRMGCKLPKGVLMSGPPGTGKTLMARALAGEAGVPFLSTNGASFDEVFVGVGVMRVKKLFERAKELSPCIIFIDEIDAIANTRMQMGTAHSSDSLNALLSEMDGFDQNNGVIVIAATNMADRLDPALIRPGRFDRKVRVGLPDKKARSEIVKLYLGNRGDNTVNIELLVGDISGFSGADLESMVNLASIEAVKQGKNSVSMKDLIEAKEVISMGRARTTDVGIKTKKVTAYHESGHAIVSLYTKGSKPIYKATILPRGDALGFVASINDDEFMMTKESLLAQLDVCMGGRAAEEIFNGKTQITTGASSDFNKATNIATKMVTQWGMSPKIGKVYYSTENLSKLSPELQNIINKEVKRLLDESFHRATKLIKKHKNKLELLANELIKKETLSGDEIKTLIKWSENDKIEPKDFILKFEYNNNNNNNNNNNQRKQPQIQSI